MPMPAAIPPAADIGPSSEYEGLDPAALLAAELAAAPAGVTGHADDGEFSVSPAQAPLNPCQPCPWPQAAREACLHGAVRDLRCFSAVAAERAAWQDSQWRAEIEAVLPEPTAFRAGAFGTAAPLWRAYFAATSLDGHPLVQRILPWLAEGYSLTLQPVALQANHPHQPQRLQRARRALARVVGANRADTLLTGSEPPPISLPNHQSASEHADFVRNEIAAFLAVGALQLHDPDLHGPPTIHPLSVAVKETTGKRRLCVDANLTNLWEPYRPVHFELLPQVLQLLRLGDIASTSDLTKGYLHVPLHPASRRFLAVRFEGTTYVFAALPFGLQSAVWAFQSIMQAVYLPLRQAGWRLSFMIDDCITLWRARVECWLGTSIFVRLLCCLGAHFSLPKCLLGPRASVRYQGMLLHLTPGTVAIPPEKLLLFDRLVESILSSPSTTPRKLASLAGLLVSFHVAVPLGPLFTQHLFSMLASPNPDNWDAQLSLDGASSALLRWLRAHMPANNGKRWWRRNPSVVLVTDASARGAGGAAAAPLQVCVSLQAQLPQSVVMHSSGCREVAAMVTLLASLIASPTWLPHLRHGCLKIITDSQVAAADVSRMRGSPPILQQVCQLYSLAAPHDVELQVEWRPREHPLLQYADYLSKCTDPGDWGLSPQTFADMLAELGCPAPSVDWFAAPWNAKAPRFVARYLMPGACGVNAFDYCWQLPAGQLSLVCPPQTIIPRVLAKLEADRASCILILPAWLHMWHGQLGLLPVLRACAIPGSAIAWGPRAPQPAMRASALMAGLRAYLVHFA